MAVNGILGIKLGMTQIFADDATMREIITLQCNDCKNRNYTTTKNRRKHTERLETSKFCNTCRKHTGHKEVK